MKAILYNFFNHRLNDCKKDITDRYSYFNSYKNIVDGFLKAKGYQTSREIAFLSIKLESFPKDIVRRLGRPKVRVTVSKHIDVLFYKRKFLKEKTRVEYHFYKGKLFFICVKFSKLDEQVKKEVIKVLELKYGARFDLGFTVVKNQLNHAVKVDNQADFNLNYFLLNSDLLEKIQSINKKEALELKKENEKNKRSLYRNV